MHHPHLLAWAVILASIIPSVAAESLPHLRIQPLGDSITKGSLSSDGNGYRKFLRDRLVSHGNSSDISVDMIGSLRSGNMADNDHEGHSGEFLADIQDYVQLSIKARPNVVLLHAGTNNMDKEVDIDTAPEIIASIIDDLFEGAPDAVVLVAPVIWANDTRMQNNTDAFNKKLQTTIAYRQKDDRHILPVPINITVTDLADMKHPNDRGYRKMSTAWYEAILEAGERGWLKDPVSVDDSDEVSGMGLGTADGDEDEGGSEEGGSEKGEIEEGEIEEGEIEEGESEKGKSEEGESEEDKDSPASQLCISSRVGIVVTVLGSTLLML